MRGRPRGSGCPRSPNPAVQWAAGPPGCCQTGHRPPGRCPKARPHGRPTGGSGLSQTLHIPRPSGHGHLAHASAR
eukprot:4332334-Lingulodinium_polyedra.AAC.1